MDYKNNDKKDYEPTQDEWDEIEELILAEEDEEHMLYEQDKKICLLIFSNWCKENGILW